MKLPIEWIRSLVETQLSDTELADALTMAGLEVEEIIDGVFHTKVTPNRGDWLSALGTAREAAAAINAPSPRARYVMDIAPSSGTSSVSVEVADSHMCPRYSCCVFHDVKMLETPDWMVRRLQDCGMRSVNVIVDITNYVMLELGQPLHAFDLNKVSEAKIVVRPSTHGEFIRTIDGIDRKLPAGMLVIADAKAPIAVAGVMGGVDSEVTEHTTSIVLESAHFDPLVVRKSAKLLGLSSEASYRFERFVDPSLVESALARAASLLAKYANAKREASFLDIYPLPVTALKLRLRTSRLNSILGTEISSVVAADALRRLQFEADIAGDEIAVVVPSFRSDIVREIDLIEEVARIVGYEGLPESLPTSGPVSAGDTEQGAFANRLRMVLSGLGAHEALTHSLSSPSPFELDNTDVSRVKIRSALSAELSGLRTSLVPNLLSVLVHNARQRVSDVQIFEIGKVFREEASAGEFIECRSVALVLHGKVGPSTFRWDKSIAADFFVAKGYLETLTKAVGVERLTFVASRRPGMHPGRCADIVVEGTVVGYVAEVDSSMLRSELSSPNNMSRVAVMELDAEALLHAGQRNVHYTKAPRFPSIARDLAVVVNDTVSYAALEEIVVTSSDAEITESVELRSIFSGDKIGAGKKSVAVRVTFRAADRTLLDSDVEAQMSTILGALTKGVEAVQR